MESMMSNLHLKAEMDYWTAQRSEALAALDMIFTKPVAIGEHTDIQKEIHDWTNKLSQAVENLNNLKTYFQPDGSMKKVKSLIQG